ncbi:unnamed protein product [Lota lota]
MLCKHAGAGCGFSRPAARLTARWRGDKRTPRAEARKTEENDEETRLTFDPQLEDIELIQIFANLILICL